MFGVSIVISRIRTRARAEVFPRVVLGIHLTTWPFRKTQLVRAWTGHHGACRMADATAAPEYLLLKVRDSPKPFDPKPAGRSSFEQGRLGIVFLLDGTPG